MRLLDRAVEETATLWVIFQNHTGFFAFHIRGSYCSCFRSPACRCLSWNGWNLVVVVVFLHINSLSNVHPYITCKAAGSIAVCLILSKLDYCNGLLSGLPQKQIKRLLIVQNCAVRAVMKCKKKRKKIMSFRFLNSFIGFPTRFGPATKLSLSHTGQYGNIPPLHL